MSQHNGVPGWAEALNGDPAGLSKFLAFAKTALDNFIWDQPEAFGGPIRALAREVEAARQFVDGYRAGVAAKPRKRTRRA